MDPVLAPARPVEVAGDPVHGQPHLGVGQAHESVLHRDGLARQGLLKGQQGLEVVDRHVGRGDDAPDQVAPAPEDEGPVELVDFLPLPLVGDESGGHLRVEPADILDGHPEAITHPGQAAVGEPETAPLGRPVRDDPLKSLPTGADLQARPLDRGIPFSFSSSLTSLMTCPRVTLLLPDMVGTSLPVK